MSDRTDPPPAPGIRNQLKNDGAYLKRTQVSRTKQSLLLVPCCLCLLSLFLRCFLLSSNSLTFTFPGTAVGFCTLATNRKAFTMTKTTVTSNIQ